MPIYRDARTGNTWGHSPAPPLLVASTRGHFPDRADAVAGPALAVLIMIGGLTSAGHPGPHSQVTEGERERVHGRTWDSAFIEVEGGVPRVSQEHSLLVNLKQRARIKT